MNIKSIASKIGMDYENTLEAFCGDVNALTEKLLAFPSSADITALSKAIESGDEESIRTEAHRMRKSSEKLGLTQLAKLFRIVEEAGPEKRENAFREAEKEYAEIAALLK